MVFSSNIFLFYFLPFALAVYYSLYRTSQRTRNGALALLGYLFYGWANPKFVFLMLFTTLVDWSLSIVIAGGSWSTRTVLGKGDIIPLEKGTARNRTQRVAITLSILSNLLLLGYFKYFNFGVDTYNHVVHLAGMNQLTWGSALHVFLPLGISFYVFQSLSYTK